jgi:hypothetical protein
VNLPTTGSWLAYVRIKTWPVSLSLTSHAQPLPWIPASAALNLFLKEE